MPAFTDKPYGRTSHRHCPTRAQSPSEATACPEPWENARLVRAVPKDLGESHQHTGRGKQVHAAQEPSFPSNSMSFDEASKGLLFSTVHLSPPNPGVQEDYDERRKHRKHKERRPSRQRETYVDYTQDSPEEYVVPKEYSSSNHSYRYRESAAPSWMTARPPPDHPYAQHPRAEPVPRARTKPDGKDMPTSSRGEQYDSASYVPPSLYRFAPVGDVSTSREYKYGPPPVETRAYSYERSYPSYRVAHP